ncbi:MAG TPA: hypothetical protein VF950_29250 [Planctomycetota bacterium]
MPARKLLLFDLALLAILILASRLALVAHEGGGHALPALACGASDVELKLSPLGGGYVKYRLASPSPAQIALIKLGGIAVNLATGLVAWILARRMSSRGLVHLGLLIFGVGSVGGALVYLSNGLYYGSGDPTGFAPRTLDIAALRPLWLLGPPAGAAVAWIAAGHWSDVLSTLVTPKGRAGRIGWTLVTLGVAGAAYGGLWLALRDAKIEGSTRQWRLEREVAKEVERRTTSPAAPVVVKPEDVAHRLPSPAGPIAFYAAGLLAGAVSLARPWKSGLPGAWPPWGAAALGVVAAGTVALLRVFG